LAAAFFFAGFVLSSVFNVDDAENFNPVEAAMLIVAPV
jgi:hypothetical protein